MQVHLNVFPQELYTIKYVYILYIEAFQVSLVQQLTFVVFLFWSVQHKLNQ